MKALKTDKENIFRDVNSKSLSIADEQERNKIKQQRKLVDRINNLELSIMEINKKLDYIFTKLSKINDPRTY